MMSWNGHWSWGNWVAMSLIMIAFWVVLVVAAVTLLRGLRRPRANAAGADPQQILDRRLARGEITDEEYRHRGELLRAPRNRAPEHATRQRHQVLVAQVHRRLAAAGSRRQTRGALASAWCDDEWTSRRRFASFA